MLATGIKEYKRFGFDIDMEEAPTLQIKRILLAEDDDDDFHILNSVLLHISPSVEILRTKNGIMVSSLMETSFKPDMIILDMNMPFKNGISCLNEIKTKENLDSIKVVIHSTSFNNREVEASYNGGADLYLVKAASFSAMVQQFKKLFSNQYLINNEKVPRNQFVSYTDFDSFGFFNAAYKA